MSEALSLARNTGILLRWIGHCNSIFSYPVLVFRGLDGEMRRVVCVGNNSLPQEDEIPECFLDVDVSRLYVYALYNDPSFPDESCVLVIDWDGAPVARLRIAKRCHLLLTKAAEAFWQSTGTTESTVS